MIIKLIKKMFFLCWDFLLFATGEGSWKLRPIEILVLNAIRDYVSNETLRAINAQLAGKYFVQRMNADRVNSIIFYEKNSLHRIKDDKFNDFIFKVELVLDDKKEYAHVKYFEGFISSIEFKKASEFYSGKKIEIGRVILSESDVSHSAAIDRLEHGRNCEGP